jgi:Tol biopolymer transport system component
MGEVYRARDEKLQRDVAIKVLPRDLQPDDERVRRFTNEARAASALNHPHILTIYDIGDAGGVPFIAMELVDGVTLRDRLRSGPIAYDEALEIARQIATALAAAHERGLVHRDLKPENVMLRRDGYVKVVDFGLAALCADPSLRPADAGAFETVKASTGGTPAYMAPEQVNGSAVGPAADVFAFGVVLCELLTGVNPYARSTTLDTLNAIARTPEPAVDATSRLPESIGRLIVTSVARDPSARYTSMNLVSAELARLRQERAVPRGPRQRGVLVGAATAALVAAMFVVWLARSPRDAAVAQAVQLTHFSTAVRDPAVSPDGKLLVYVVQDPDAPSSQLYAQTLPDGQPRQLTRTAGLKAWPAFSPDGSRIAFTVTGAEWKWDTWALPVVGGEPQLLRRNAAALQWIPDGRVLFSEFRRGAQLAVVVSGETRSEEHDIHVPPGNAMAHFSDLSPDGRSVAIGEMGAFAGADTNFATPLSCFVVALDAEATSRRTVGARDAPCSMFLRWSRDGRWLYFSSGTGSTFQVRRQRADGTGRAHQITPGTGLAVLGVLSSFALTPDGRSLVYPSGETQEAIILRREDGSISQLTLEGNARNPMPFSDGSRLLYVFGPRFASGQIWIRNIDGTSAQRLFPGFQADSAAPSPDGTHVAFTTSDADGGTHLWIGAVDNSVAPRELGLGKRSGAAEQVSELFGPDGKTIFFTKREPSGVVRIWRIDVDGEHLRAITDAEPGLQLRSVSPDGRWISVNRNGRTPREAWLVPTDGSGPGRKLWNSWAFAWTPGNRAFLVSTGGMVSSAWLLANPSGALFPPDLGQSPTEETLARAGARNVLTDYFFIEPTPMPAPFTIAYSKVVNHSNLYQLALPR